MSSAKPPEFYFECQQSGFCCCDPKIIVTTTFLDIHSLYLALEREFEYLLKKLSFYRIDTDLSPELRKKLVLSAIHTTDGEIIPGLRKINGQNCVFYTRPNCSIYRYRPRACKNYPIAFLGNKSKNRFIWAKDSEKVCPGVGKGRLLSLTTLIQEGKMTLEDIQAHNDLINELNTEASKGTPLSAREVIWLFIVYAEKYLSTKEE